MLTHAKIACPGLKSKARAFIIEYENREQILISLTETLRNSFETGKIPEDWKLAKVIPIFKKGKKSDPINYRPVSLTLTVCKIMETIIRDKITEHLEEQDLIDKAQNGFRS